MKRLLLPLLAVLAPGVLLHSTSPRLAHACTPDEDYNPVHDSDVVVAGRITGWERIENVTRWDPKSAEPPTDDPNYYGPYEPIRLHVAVERTYKGQPATSIDVVDAASLRVYDGAQQWAGTSGACGTFDSDPRGQYIILGVDRDEFARYRSSLLGLFFMGPAPTGERYERAVERVTAEEFDFFPWFIGGLVTMLTLPTLIAVALVWRGRGPYRGQ